MSFIVHSYNKKLDTTYCYECENYKDEKTGQWKSRRRIIGKLDKDGKTIPTGKRGRKPKARTESSVSVSTNADEREAVSRAEIEKEIRDEVTAKLQGRIISLQEQNIAIKRENDQLRAAMNTLLGQLKTTVESVQNKLNKS